MELDKKIEEYGDELFTDLGLTNLPEEQKAEIYARLEDHLHEVIISHLSKILEKRTLRTIQNVLDQEDYRYLSKILKKYPQHAAALEEKVKQEFDNLKLIIGEEQKNVTRKESF